jgi:indole-3-glycerol phosphate synthase
MNILKKIIEQTWGDLQQKMAQAPLPELAARAEQICQNHARNRFRQAIKRDKLQIIAEIKKASPSRGLMCTDFNPEKIAQEYVAGGAAAISVLTEPHFFQGNLDYLRQLSQQITLPLLRKDFIVHEYQIYEAVTYGAAAVLLIVAALTDDEIRSFLDLCRRLRLDALIEVHNEIELQRAVQAGAEMIGINNRNLITFTIDLQTSFDLVQKMPAQVVRVTESGLSNRGQLTQMQEAGFHAALLGEILMKQPNRKQFLNELRGE